MPALDADMTLAMGWGSGCARRSRDGSGCRARSTMGSSAGAGRAGWTRSALALVAGVVLGFLRLRRLRSFEGLVLVAASASDVVRAASSAASICSRLDWTRAWAEPGVMTRPPWPVVALAARSLRVQVPRWAAARRRMSAMATLLPHCRASSVSAGPWLPAVSRLVSPAGSAVGGGEGDGGVGGCGENCGGFGAGGAEPPRGGKGGLVVG